MSKIYKVNKDTLKAEESLDYKVPFFMSLIINGLLLTALINNDAKVINRTRVINSTDTIVVEQKDVQLNDSAIGAELTKLGCVLPNVAIAQFKIETGHYKSAICRENKNLAGIRNSASPLSVGKNRGHNVYETYRDCLKDYIRVQNKYLKNIDGKYAEAKGYINQIKMIK